MNLFADFMSAKDFIEKLIPNFWSFLIQLLSLIVLIVVIIVFAYKPVKKILKTRQDYIESNIQDAEKAKANAILQEREAKELVLSKQKEANEIIVAAKEAAEAQKQQILDQTQLELVEMKEKAIEEIKQEEAEAKETIRKEMIDIALDASSVLLKREVTSDDNKRLVEDFIKDIE